MYINKHFEKRIIREGIVDTTKFRYITKEQPDGLYILRLRKDDLDTTEAVNGWEVVKKVGE